MTDRIVSLELAAKTTGLDDLKRVADELKEIAKAGGEAAPKAKELLAELERIADRTETARQTEVLKQEYAELSKELTNTSRRLTTANANLEKQAEALAKAQKAYDKFDTAVRNARNESDRLSVAYREAKHKLEDLIEAYPKLEDMTKKQQNEYHKLRDAVDSTNRAQQEAAIAVRNGNVDLRNARKALEDVSEAYDKVAKKQKLELKLSVNQTAVKDSKKAEVDASVAALSKMGVANNANSIANAASLGDLQAAIANADKLKASLIGLKTASEVANESLNKAFSNANVRPMEEIQNEILGIRQSLMALANNSNLTDGQFSKAMHDGEERIKHLRAELEGVDLSAKNTKRTFNDMAVDFAKGAVLSEVLFGAMGAMQGAASQAVQTAAAMETLKRGMTAVFGSQAAAAKELEYVNSVADRTGTSVLDLGKAYSKVALSAREAGFSQEQARQVFEAVSGSMGVLGESSAETGFALQAITQMLSKGVVSMEEFRQQLAERLPGAFEATARELGLTTAELNTFIATGKATAFDVLPALAKGLEKVYPTKDQNNTLAGGWERFKNAMRSVADDIGESGALQMGFKGVRVVAAAVVGALGEVVEGIRAIGTVGAGLATGDLRGALDKVGEDFGILHSRIVRIAGTLEDTQLAALQNAKAIEAAGKSAEGASTGFVKLMVDLKNAEDNASAHATAMRKAAEYTRSSGEAAATAAANLATETEQRRIATQIAERNVTAVQGVLAAETEVLQVKQKALAAVEELAAASEDEKKRRADTIEKTTNEINTQRELVEGLKLQVQELQNVSIARQIDAEALKYNGDKVAQYRQVLTAAQLAMQQLNAEHEQGPVALAKVIAAQNAVAASTKLYADSLSDLIDKKKAEITVTDASTDLASASIRLKQEQYRTSYEMAKANGDERAAAFALVQIKRLEADLTRLNAEAKKAEAAATRQLVALQREELRVKNELTPAKELELKMQEKRTEVAIKEADIQLEIAKRTERLTYATQNQAVVAKAATESTTALADGYSTLAEEADAATNSINQLGKAQASVRNGKLSEAQSIDYENIARQKGLVGDAVKRFVDAMSQTMAEEQATMQSNLKRFNGTMEASTYQEYVRGANDRAVQRALDMANQGAPTTQSTTAQTQPNAPTTPDGVRFVKRPFETGNTTVQNHTVVIHLGNTKRKVGVASAQDAASLQDVLKQINQDRERV